MTAAGTTVVAGTGVGAGASLQAGIRVEGLRKRFGRFEVLKGVDFEAAPGRVTALVGPNAAGKSTLIKAMLGLVRLRPGDGRITVAGAVVNGDEDYRSRIGYMPQAARFPDHLSPREVLGLIGSLRPASTPQDRELLERFDLAEAFDRPVRTLSGGTRQKLNAAVAFLFRPAVLILDEPTAGLDPIAAGVFKDKVRRVAEAGCTVLLTSHILTEVEELAHDIVFLTEGRVAFRGTIPALLAQAGETRLEPAVAALMERDR
ncbi:MAG: ABC transporter ATP-binding protein [Gemmatimonadales bacterium]